MFDVFYSHHFHQDVSAAIAAIFGVILLQEYKGTSVVSCVAVTPQQSKSIYLKTV
jgi:hypothetical protein